MATAAQQQPTYEVVWKAPDRSLMADVLIHAGDNENEAITAAAAYVNGDDSPVAGHVEIRHQTPAGTLIAVRTVDRGDGGVEIRENFLQDPDDAAVPEDEAATISELAQEAEALEQQLDNDGGEPSEVEQAAETAQAAQQNAHERGELFDADQYEREDLALPKVDGRGIDKIRIAFSGSIMLDRSNPDHVALFKDLELGKDVELRVAGDVVSTGTGWTTNKDGDLDAIVSERKIKVSTVYMLKPEEL